MAPPGSSTASCGSPQPPAPRATTTKAARLIARAYEIFEKISPLKKTDPERIAVYGLIPIQQPADIYDGWGHGGRGGWSWYTGSAARMLSAAYALLGIVQTDGAIGVRDDLFEPKGELQLESLRIGGSIWRRGAEEHHQPIAAD